MTELERNCAAKIPGADTEVTLHNSFCDICAPGPHCGVTCYVKNGTIIKVEGTADHPGTHGLLCPRGQATRQYIYRPDRILTPLLRVGERGEGLFRPISWDEAFAVAAQRLGGVKAQYGANAVAFYSGYNKWYRPFLQRLCYSFGSVNYGSESSTCFTSTIMSWRLATGADSVAPDLSACGVFLGWFCNSLHSGYPMIGGLRGAKARGAKIVIVDTRITPTVEQFADLHLRPLPATDGALALCLGRELIEHGWTDADYIEKNVYGFADYAAYVQTFTPEYTQSVTGVPAEEIRQAARLIHENMPLSVGQSGSSAVHHKNGLQNHRAIMALAALTGCYGQPGGNKPGFLTYAHSKGGFHTGEEEFVLETYPKNQPLPVGSERYPLWQELIGEMQACDLARQVREGSPYPVKAVWAHGINYRMFNGDEEVRKALNALDFFVDTDLFLTDTARMADLVLPACSSFEREEFKVYGGGRVQYTEKVIQPLGESRSDTDILFGLAQALDLPDPLLRAGYDACVGRMVEGTGIDLAELKKGDRQLPRVIPGLADAVKPPLFSTPSGKFELKSTVLERYPSLDALPTYRSSLDDGDPAEFPLVLVAGARLPYALHSRLHDVPWLRSLRQQPMADLSLEDAAELGLQEGDEIVLRTSAGTLTLKANPTFRVLKGTVHLYHGYREADVNAIIPAGHNDPYSGFPGYCSVRCVVGKKEAEA